ncbi:hypothetical protein L249_8526 [Ophiocordyceps polyrhachis-furcata BCC 54312]|uniref:Uncharacterized protein n=1 Tax=Ophiocordyceps polyrhachis-furcata BCC 54312 TaxID=1330021 RepID=A0A367L773_9HYPO|nr:hypothetical protein L249_8526 [Ophiocordyceps polyrhachis-furcata BCC 54312]
MSRIQVPDCNLSSADATPGENLVQPRRLKSKTRDEGGSQTIQQRVSGPNTDFHRQAPGQGQISEQTVDTKQFNSWKKKQEREKKNVVTLAMLLDGHFNFAPISEDCLERDLGGDCMHEYVD